MLTTTIDEVEGAFTSAKNLNAALKNFLKKEVGSDNSVERFAKNFRSAVSSGRPMMVRSFIEQYLPDHEIHFLQAAHYAHSAFIASFVEQIVTSYGDEFNATYVKKDHGIEIHDKEKFSKIVKEVAEKMDLALKQAGLPASNFMKNSMLVSVFEEDVLVEVLNTLKK